MNRAQKVTSVAQLASRVGAARAAIFAEYRGLTVEKMTSLRAKMRKVQATLKVVKNRLATRALRAANVEGVEHFLVGPTAMAASDGDAAALAKTLVDFAKEEALLKVKGGLVEGKIVDWAAIKALASLPSRDILLAQLIGTIQAPATQIARVLTAVPRKLVLTLKALETTKQ